MTSSEQNRLSREKVDRTVGRRLFNERLSHDREGQIGQYVKQEWLSSVLCTVSWKCCTASRICKANMQEDCRDRGIFSEGKLSIVKIQDFRHILLYICLLQSQKPLFLAKQKSSLPILIFCKTKMQKKFA